MRPMITYRALENGASGFEIGLLAAVYALIPLFIAVSMGRWIGKLGAVPLLLAGCLTFVLLAFGFVFLNNFIAIAATTALAGIAHLSNVAASQSLVATRSENTHQERNFGYFSFATSTGHTFGPILGGIIAGSSGVLPRSSSSAFIFAGVLALLSLVPLLMVRELHQSKTAVEREKAENISARSVLARPGIKGAIWTSLAVSASNDLLVVVLPLVGTENQISPIVIGAILSLRSAAAMISRFSLGMLSRKFGSYVLLKACIYISAILLFITFFAKSAVTLGTSMFFVGLLLGIGQPLTMAIVSRQSPLEERAMAITIRLSGNRLGQFLVPIGSGALAGAFGGQSIFLGLSALVGSAGLISARSEK